MPRRALIRERVDQPQGLVAPAQLTGLRTTFLHAPSMGVHEAARSARRNGVLGAGIDVRGMNGELAYRFTGAHGNGGCSWGTTPTCFGATAILMVARFRLRPWAATLFARWGPSGTFLIATDAAGDIVLAAGSGVNSSGWSRKQSAWASLSAGR